MEKMFLLLVGGSALFAMMSPIYLAIRVRPRWRLGVRTEFPWALWLLSSATQLLLVAVALVSVVLPVQVPFHLVFGSVFLGVALSAVINWLKPAGWTKGDLRVSFIANLAILWVTLAMLLVVASFGRGH